MFKMFLTTLVLTVFTFAEAPLLKTGQTISYDQDGNVVTDGSVKDDGYYQAGVNRSYSSAVGVVKDNVTGLEWQDDYSDNGGSIKSTDWQGAIDYCAALGLADGGWRLPTIEELETLVDDGKHLPSVTDNVFQHISSDYYLSSTTVASFTSSAWIMYFGYGSSSSGDKGNNYYVRCVRGGQLEPSNLSRIGEIVTDSTTGLQWQDNEIVKTTTRLWQEAIDYCENDVTLGGHNDWRMPNKKELLSIVDRSQYGPAVDTSSNGFQNFSSYYYWSSTTDAHYTDYAWFVDFYYGSSGYSYKDHGNYVRCVRGGQVNKPINPSIIMYLLD